MRIRWGLAFCAIVATTATARAANNYLYGFVIASYSCTPQYGNRSNLKVATNVFQYCPYGSPTAAAFNGDAFARRETDGNMRSTAQMSCALGTLSNGSPLWQGGFGNAASAAVSQQSSCSWGCLSSTVSIYVPNTCKP
jgi:hypothetical protein